MRCFDVILQKEFEEVKTSKQDLSLNNNPNMNILRKH